MTLPAGSWNQGAAGKGREKGRIRRIMAFFDPFRCHKNVDKPLPNRHIRFIRVAARFFSGVPHPHLLGVCCPDFISKFHFFHISRQFASKTMAKTFEAKLDAGAIFS
jgi:hypothetical protein